MARIVIDLKKDANATLILNYLLKNTDLQINYNFNMVAIVNKRPKYVGVLDILDAFIAHQKEVVTRRTEFDLEHAKRAANFEHLYRQWFQMLKNGIADQHWLKSVETDMAALGVAIAAARRELVARLNTFITREPDDIFPNVRLELDGLIEKMLDNNSALNVEDFYVENLEKQRRNVLNNESIDGVNRTDFKVFFQKKNMPAELCSTGEQKALLVSIILAQTKCQILSKGFAPILLLDEVATHLDNQKRDALLNKIRDLRLQAWITSTEPQNFAILRRDAQFFRLEDGKLF
jgi:DNA replication and repair protein RecF